MTENKRFTIETEGITNKEAVWEGDRLISFVDDKKCIEQLVDLLNCLYNENEELKKENGKIIERNNELFFKAPIWFTQSPKLTDKQIQKVAEAIEQDLKERGIKYV